MRFQKLLPNNLAGVLNEKSNFSLVEYVDISRSLPNYRLPAKLLFKPKRKKFCFEAFATSTIWLVKTIYFNWLYFILFFQKALLFSMVVIFVSWFNIRFFCFIHSGALGLKLFDWSNAWLDLSCPLSWVIHFPIVSHCTMSWKKNLKLMEKCTLIWNVCSGWWLNNYIKH